LTPETDAMVAADLHDLEDDESCPASAYWRMVELTRTLERERNEARHQLLAIFAREHLTCGWCGEMMDAPPGFTPPITTDNVKAAARIHILDCPAHPIRETERELAEVRAQLREEQHLHTATLNERDRLAGEIEAIRPALETMPAANTLLKALAAVEAPKGIPIRDALGDSRSYFPGTGCQCAARSESECGCPGVDWTPRELRELRSKYAMHHAEAERLTELVHAARALVNRWDTPLWKDAPATAEYINRLRALLPENEKSPSVDANEKPMP
jgi:hypothetical protein